MCRVAPANGVTGMLFSKQLKIAGMIIAAVLGIAACIPKCYAQDAQQSDPDRSFLSRVTVEVPVYTRHIPNDAGFNDHNWGAFINVDLAKYPHIEEYAKRMKALPAVQKAHLKLTPPKPQTMHSTEGSI